jgi:UDP-2,3-diacylglucosamine pyrophosphatase LpxH
LFVVHYSLFILYAMKKETRRHFLSVLATSGVGLAVAPRLFAAETTPSAPQEAAPESRPLVDSFPVLQCPAETGITVVWAVGQPAAGIVEFGTKKDKLDQVATGDVFGLNAYNKRFLQVRIENLQPNTRYYYRTVTRSFQFETAYKQKQGEPVYSDVYSFETQDKTKSNASFSVINDTHNNQETLSLLGDRIAQLNADYLVWNGDLVNSFDNADTVVKAILRPGGKSFAANKPLLFVPGNHDYRGEWARNLHLALPAWEHEAPEDRKFGRNFVVRTGPLALIGLDTGEDKPDFRAEWSGLARFEPYRKAQRDWLERALQSLNVASASFVVAFCHIPLFSANPKANGGDVAEGYADYQRQALELWGPLLNKYNVQAVIAAHTHKFEYDAADRDRKWAQILGGGPSKHVTIIHGHVEKDALEIIVNEVITNTELGRFTFKKRS